MKLEDAKIGQRVIVARRSDYSQYRCSHLWNCATLARVEKGGRITEVHTDTENVCVHFDDGYEYFFNRRDLDPIRVRTDLPVGKRIRVAKVTETLKRRGESRYVLPLVGKFGKIVKSPDIDNEALVDIGSRSKFYINADDLEIAPSMEDFHVGQKVKIVRRSKDYPWYQDGSMDWTIGIIGEVSNTGCYDDQKRAIQVVFTKPDGVVVGWFYAPEDLELVEEPSPKPKPNLAKVKVIEFVANNGEKSYEITGFVNMKNSYEVPVSYMVGTDAPRFVVAGDKSSINLIIPAKYKDDIKGMRRIETALPHDVAVFEVKVGDVLDEKSFLNVIKWMRRAGARLGAINRRLKNAKETKPASPVQYVKEYEI